MANGKGTYTNKNIKYLGILLDQNLRWSKHISQVEKKLSRAFGVLSRLIHKASGNILEMVFNSLCTCHLN